MKDGKFSYSCEDEIEQLVHAFENCTLARDQWTHQAHLAVALWYLTHFSEVETVAHLRHNIARYRRCSYQSQGLPLPSEGGYHETITLFYVRVISQYLCEGEPDVSASVADLANVIIKRWGDKSSLFLYYSPERLFSQEARIGWVVPDLKPLE